MGTPTSKPTPERARTDRSLHDERQNTDRVLEEHRIVVEADRDHAVDHAREHADAALSAAREKTDDRLDSAPPGVRAVVEDERRVEDLSVERERAIADETLEEERRQNAKDLLALLPLERMNTDRSLLTERVDADQEVSNRDDFLGMVSHDLRDLLGGIATSAAVLLRTAPLGEDGAATRAGANRIQRYSARMKRLIDDLTDLTSIDAGKLRVNPAPGNLAPVISESVGALVGAAAAKEIALTPPHLEEPVHAFFDADRILQVLINLIANAIKFTPPHGTVRIECARSNDTVWVSVIDTGQGVPPQLLDAIFERYRQGMLVDRRGLGLGLYIARTLIEAQRGKIWAESTVGKGTTVTFTLPA